MAKKMVDYKQIFENANYGKFIIQTNEVHFFLFVLILARTFSADKKFKDQLEGMPLGSVISHFRVCVRNVYEQLLLDKLYMYKSYRNDLAHKMLSERKLTKTKCTEAIFLGKDIINKLVELIKEEQQGE